MTQTKILFIGMNVHKESNVISLAVDDRSEVRRYNKSNKRGRADPMISFI